MKRYISVLLIIAIIFSMFITVQSDFAIDDETKEEKKTGVIRIVWDKSEPKAHQALKWSVGHKPSSAPIQAAIIGWNIIIGWDKEIEEKESGGIEVFIPTPPKHEAVDKTYEMPILNAYAGTNASAIRLSSVENYISSGDKDKFYELIEKGCTIKVDARIQKFKHSNGKYTPVKPEVFANSKTDIDKYFSEFTEKYKNITKSNDFDMFIDLDGEDVPDMTEFTVNHYEKGTTKKVYPSDTITVSPNSTIQAHAKTGIGAEGEEWICTVSSPQTVEVASGGEYNFYYVKLLPPKVIANCKGNIVINRKTGGTWKPEAYIKNVNNVDVYVEYELYKNLNVSKKANLSNFASIPKGTLAKKGSVTIKANSTATVGFTHKFPSNTLPGKLVKFTVIAKQRYLPTSPVETIKKAEGHCVACTIADPNDEKTMPSNLRPSVIIDSEKGHADH